jgi:hypothetical protein
LGHDDLFSYQSKIIFGSAVLRSISQHNEPTLLTVLSEVDLKRQEGGTRDTMKLWPYPQHHVNINPDIFVSQITASENAPSVQSVQAAPENESTPPERPVLYIVYCELSEASANEHERLSKIVHASMEVSEEAMKHFSIEKDGIMVMYDAQASAEALVHSIHEYLFTLKVPGASRIILHAGPVYLEEPSNQQYSKAFGNTIDEVKKMSSVAMPGMISASENFAALLALNDKSYSLEYSGVLQADESSRSFPVYKVGIKVKY